MDWIHSPFSRRRCTREWKNGTRRSRETRELFVPPVTSEGLQRAWAVSKWETSIGNTLGSENKMKCTKCSTNSISRQWGTATLRFERKAVHRGDQFPYHNAKRWDLMWSWHHRSLYARLPAPGLDPKRDRRWSVHYECLPIGTGKALAASAGGRSGHSEHRSHHPPHRRRTEKANRNELIWQLPFAPRSDRMICVPFVRILVKLLKNAGDLVQPKGAKLGRMNARSLFRMSRWPTGAPNWSSASSIWPNID